MVAAAPCGCSRTPLCSSKSVSPTGHAVKYTSNDNAIAHANLSDVGLFDSCSSPAWRPCGASHAPTCSRKGDSLKKPPLIIFTFIYTPHSLSFYKRGSWSLLLAWQVLKSYSLHCCVMEYSTIRQHGWKKAFRQSGWGRTARTRTRRPGFALTPANARLCANGGKFTIESICMNTAGENFYGKCA